MALTLLEEHHSYLSDTRRTALLHEAIARAVTPGCHVVDLGCGSGFLGLLALRAGAGSVTAIEATPILDIARQTMAREGFLERCTFLSGSSYALTLPEPADLVVCDHVGYFGFDYDLLGILQDARHRFLKPGGILLPRKLHLYCAPVTSANCWKMARVWSADGMPEAYAWLDSYATNTKQRVMLTPPELAGPPAHLAAFDLRIDHPPVHTWSARLRADHACTLHGIAGWFRVELADGVDMTNAPLASARIDRYQAFLPIAEPVDVEADTEIGVSITARPADSIIQWRVELPALAKRFTHSTWQGMILTPEELKRSQPDGVPVLSPQGRVRALALSYCDGKRTVREIEERVLSELGDTLPSRTEVSKLVYQVLGRDTQ